MSHPLIGCTLHKHKMLLDVTNIWLQSTNAIQLQRISITQQMDVHLNRIERSASPANRCQYQRQRLASFLSGLKSSLSSRSDDQHLHDLASRADHCWCAREARSCDIAGQTSLHHVHSSDTPIICHRGSNLNHYRRPPQLPVSFLSCLSCSATVDGEQSVSNRLELAV